MHRYVLIRRCRFLRLRYEASLCMPRHSQPVVWNQQEHAALLRRRSVVLSSVAVSPLYGVETLQEETSREPAVLLARPR